MPGPHGFAVRSNPASPSGFAGLWRRSSARRLIAHGKPALQLRSHRRCRVHRSPPHVRDDGQRPSAWDGMAGFINLIWGNQEEEYFRSPGWTKPMRDLPVGQHKRWGVENRNGRRQILRTWSTLSIRSSPNAFVALNRKGPEVFGAFPRIVGIHIALRSRSLLVDALAKRDAVELGIRRLFLVEVCRQ